MIDGKMQILVLFRERVLDSDELDAFDLSEDSGCLEPQVSLKERVVKVLEAYLTVGAARAKAIGSDAYLRYWRGCGNE